jgi:hypothetical protein
VDIYLPHREIEQPQVVIFPPHRAVVQPQVEHIVLFTD